MKISVSLSDDDLDFLDRETREGTFPSRSAAVAAGIRALRERELIGSYLQAFADWDESGDADAWASVTADGIE